MTLAPPQFGARVPAQGSGALTFTHVGGSPGRTAITHATAQSPLRLLTPRTTAAAAWAFTSSYGGGLVAGDHIALDVHAGEGTTCYLSTQSSTKVFKSTGDQIAQQSLHATVEQSALLMVSPDPVVCFADARYRQEQRFDLAPGGSLLLLDWFTSGRHGRGECWAFSRFDSRNEINIAGKRILTDILRLDETDGPVAGSLRVGAFNCFATLVLVGPRLASEAARLLVDLGARPIRQNQPLVYGVSPLADGLLLRVAAISTEHAAHFLYEQLAFIKEFLGEHPWLRKW